MAIEKLLVRAFSYVYVFILCEPAFLPLRHQCEKKRERKRKRGWGVKGREKKTDRRSRTKSERTTILLLCVGCDACYAKKKTIFFAIEFAIQKR